MKEADDDVSIQLRRELVHSFACLQHVWCWWARGKQMAMGADRSPFPDCPLPPTVGRRWRTMGFLTGRGFGKTRSVSEYVVREARLGRAMRIALIAQSEDKTREVMVEGKSGLIATSPPWFKPELVKGVLTWPNGAQAFLYTPEPPGHEALRGPEHHLAWCSEFVAWPQATRREALSNLRYGLRLGYGRMVWDTTPKKKHPIVRDFLKREGPTDIIVRGSMRENAMALTTGLVEELEELYGGTRLGLEELEGIFFDDEEGALWRQKWIDDARRALPDALKRRVISVDPAISTKKGTDQTGIVEIGLGVDGQVYVIGDYTGKHSPDAWGKLVIERYLEGECDCVVVERNRGGDLVLQNLRACADRQQMAVTKVAETAKTRHHPEVIPVKEMTARDSKETRHEPVAALYERGRVSHVNGAKLQKLEDMLTTWEPSPRAQSPDAIDALVQGIVEIAGLTSKGRRRGGMRGAAELGRALRGDASPAGALGGERGALAALLGGSEWGGTI